VSYLGEQFSKDWKDRDPSLWSDEDVLQYFINQTIEEEEITELNFNETELMIC